MCKKNEGLVFHSSARAIRLINSLSHGKSENIPNIYREQFFEKLFYTKLVENHFPKVYIFLKRNLGQSFLAFCDLEYSKFLDSFLTFFLKHNNRQKQTLFHS